MRRPSPLFPVNLPFRPLSHQKLRWVGAFIRWTSRLPSSTELYRRRYSSSQRDVENREMHVCKLHQALYGIKQAPRAWYLMIDNYLREKGFQWSEADHNLNFLSGEVPLILVLYVDDLFLTGDERLIGDCKSNLAVEFQMKDLGLMHYFLGLEV